jgi:hypothetical protein
MRQSIGKYLHRAAVAVFASVAILIGTASCTFISDHPGEDWVGDNIEFDVGYSFWDAGYFIGFHPIQVPLASGTASYSPQDSAFVSAIGAKNSFSQVYEYQGEALSVEGTFTSDTSCTGKTSYLGRVLDWTAVVRSE